MLCTANWVQNSPQGPCGALWGAARRRQCGTYTAWTSASGATAVLVVLNSA